MTDTEFRRNMLRHAESAVWWAVFMRRFSDSFAIAFLLLSVVSSCAVFRDLLNGDYKGWMLVPASIGSIYGAIATQRTGQEGFQALMKCRQDALDDLKRLLP